jgi:hypothetical protein
MLLYTSFNFYDELSVFCVRFPPQFGLLLHLLDPDPGEIQMRIQCGFGSETLDSRIRHR